MRSILLPILPILASVSIACGASVPPPEAPPAPSTPVPVTDVAPPAATPPIATPPVAAPPAPPPPPRVASDVSRIQAGEWPGSNRHKFGGRWYEVKRQGSGWQFRLHDEIHFQGVGMKPSQMPRTNHQCTPWEKLPEKVAQGLSQQSLPAGDDTGASCAQLGPTCGAIKGWLTATTQPAPKRARADAEIAQIIQEEAASTYGRGQGECN